MDTRSPWAFSKYDSPFVSTREYDEKVNQENEENYQKEDIPTGGEICFTKRGFTTHISARADFSPGLNPALSVVNVLHVCTTHRRAVISARDETRLNRAVNRIFLLARLECRNMLKTMM